MMSAFGFVGMEDLADARVIDGNVQTVNTAIAASVEEHNRQVTAALAELAETTVDYSVRYMIGGGGTLQPLDEWGNPLPVKDEGYYDVAFPLQRGGTAWGTNRESRAMMTVAEAQRFTLGALRRDADWMRRHFLAALFDNTTWTFQDDLKGALTVQPLANGDAVTYARNNGTFATDTHYYAQAAAISDAANPFPTWKTELSEHPENGGTWVAYIPTNLKASVMGLANWMDKRESRVDPGIMAPRLIGEIGRGFGDEYLGYVDGVDVVEWSFLPDNYGVVIARGAESRPLRMRERTAPELRGLFTELHSPDGNLLVNRFIRICGFGVYNRVGALAFRIGDAAYAIPTGYTTPVAV